MDRQDRLTQTLGWLSLGLGGTALAAPQKVTESAGLQSNPLLVRSIVCAREVACGAGILTQRNPTPWLWARVGGDVLDLGVLCTSLFLRKARRGRTLLSTAVIADITAADIIAALRSNAQQTKTSDAQSDDAAIPAAEFYESVTVISEGGGI